MVEQLDHVVAQDKLGRATVVDGDDAGCSHGAVDGWHLFELEQEAVEEAVQTANPDLDRDMAAVV